MRLTPEQFTKDHTATQLPTHILKFITLKIEQTQFYKMSTKSVEIILMEGN